MSSMASILRRRKRVQALYQQLTRKMDAVAKVERQASAELSQALARGERDKRIRALAKLERAARTWNRLRERRKYWADQ
jgi:hypothetical protein